MTKRKRWLNNTNRRFFLIMCIIMVVVTGVVCVLLTVRSVREMKEVRWSHMESVAMMAASFVDGDAIEQFTEADAPTYSEESGKRLDNGSELNQKI